MIYIIIFLIELLSLFFFSRLLIRALAQMFYFLTGSHKATVSYLTALLLPGTIIHELSHVVMAGVLMVHSGEIEFMPQIRQDGIKLGSAEIGKTDPLRRALIGVAPVIIGSVSILGLFVYFNNLISQNQAPFWIYPLGLYLLFELSNTMFSSKKDLEGTLGILVILTSFILAIYFLGFHQPFDWLAVFYSIFLEEAVKKATFIILIPIVINTLIYFLVKSLNHKFR